MPGQRYDGPDPEGFMSQHGWVALLEAFREINRLPVDSPRTGKPVELSAGANHTSAPP